MKTLLLMRHAKSSRDDPSLTDHERPLNERGRRDAPRMGARILEAGQVPDIILCSTALRARQTAVAVAAGCGYGGSIDYLDALYATDSSTYIKTLRQLPGQFNCVLMIGHNPEIESVVADLSEQAIEMPTAAIAHLVLGIEQWPELNDKRQAQLAAVWRPKELPH